MVFDFDIDKAPKTKEFLKELTSFMETLNTPKFIKLQNNKNFDEIENILSKTYQDLFDNNYSLMFSLIRNEIKDFDILLKMINVKILLETNQISREDANEYIKEMINDIYVYPKFGGKSNFEQIIKAKHENDK